MAAVIGSTDDNPDITKYMGYYQLKIGYHRREAYIVSQRPVANWNTGYGGAEADCHLVTKHVRVYTRAYSGYGESLLTTILLITRRRRRDA